MLTSIFWRRAAGRAIRAAAACLSSLLIVSSFTPLSWVSWRDALAAAAVAGVVSLLLSIAGSQVGDPTDPAFTRKAAP